MNAANNYNSTVHAFYLAFLGRPADTEGLKFWSEHLDAVKGDLSVISPAFANSDEARTRFGGDSPTERITDIYQQLFNRAPEPAGLAFWIGAVEQGHVTMADVAFSILKGAQGTDALLAGMRERAVADFTAQVDASGSDYAGYAAVEAARVLVRAVTPGASQEDIAKLVQAAVAFADVASNNPAVVDALAGGGSLQALFDTARGQADPVTLVQALSDLAQAAAGNPAALEPLLRGGGMAKVLAAMPAGVTLRDVVDALARDGLAAAVDIVYPSGSVAPAPAPAPVGVSSLKFDSVESGTDDRDLKDTVTNLDSADVKFVYNGTIQAGQSFQYTIDGGQNWISTGIDTATRGVVVLKDVDLTASAQNPPPPVGPMAAGPTPDVLTTVQLRLVDAKQVQILSATETLVLDRFAEIPEVALVNPTAHYFGGFSHGNTSVAGFEIDGLEPGAIVQYQYVAPGADAQTWSDTMPVLADGLHTIKVRQLDAAGNASDAKEMRFTLNSEAPAKPTIRLANDTGIDDTDGVTSNGTVIIAGLGAPWLTGWEYSLDDGASWTFGGISMDGITPELDLSELDIATGALVVRQINYAGNASEVSDKLEFTFDDTAPTETLSFLRIEGEADGVLKTSQSEVDLTFDVTGKNDGIVQWRLKGSAQWTTINAYNDDGTVTIEGIDLAQRDQTIELQVIDVAGNVGYADSVSIDGPFGIAVAMTPQGLRVTSSVAGTIEIGGVAVTPTGATQAIVGTVLVGQQEFERSGVLAVRTADGQVLQDPSGRIYQLGSAQPDGQQGSHLWGFGGGDSMEGTSGDDYISGGAGNDSIYSRGGSDIISGGAGSDLIELVVDGKGSTLVYAPGDTRQGVVLSGDYFNGTDFIFGAEAGDVIQVGNILGSAPTVSDTLLTSAAAGQVAVVRSSGDSRITVNPDGTSFLVQWTDGTTINSIYFHNYAGLAMALEIDAAKGTLTLVDAPVNSAYMSSMSYGFSAAESAFHLDVEPDGIAHAGTGNGLLGVPVEGEIALVGTHLGGPGF